MKKKLTRLTRGLDFLASTYTWQRSPLRNGGKESGEKWREGKCEARKVVIMAGRTPSSIITHHNQRSTPRGSRACSHRPQSMVNAMTMRQAPAANNNNTLLLMAFFSPLLSSLLWLLIAPSRVSAFTTVTVTSTHLSSSSSISSEVKISNVNSNSFQLRWRRRRRDHHHQEDDRRSSASNHPSLAILHMSSLSTTSSDDDGERQEGTTLDVSSYMFPIADDDETKDYIMQQTMIRVKDPIQSLDFYCNILGFRLIHYSEVSEIILRCVLESLGGGVCCWILIHSFMHSF